MKRVYVLEHIAPETLGAIEPALVSRKITPHVIRTFEGEPVPKSLEEAGGLIVMGGPMGVYDHPNYPHLTDELQLIGQALKEHKPILGVCLGSQLLAAALGAPVFRGKKKEIGWHPVRLSRLGQIDPLLTGAPDVFTPCHWHGDIFELPPGAVSLASSDLTEHQAFRFGENAYGFLFHMEMTEPMIEKMVETFTGELEEEKLEGAAIQAQAKTAVPALQPIGKQIFSRWANLVSG